jgi:hypothetical protein
MPDQIQLEWTYVPADLFEERAEWFIGGCTFVIDAGTVAARAPFEGDPETIRSFCDGLHTRLEALFLVAQMQAHKPCELASPGTAVRLSPDGSKHYFVFPAPLVYKTSWGVIDGRLVDMASNAIVDTRAARIAKRRDLAQRAAELSTNPVVLAILKSYAAAVNDSGNEFLHLYEIREALAKHLHVDGKTKEGVLGGARWRRLRELANKTPVTQSRHRGAHLGKPVKEATAEQLAEARAIAQMMIEESLALLETKPPGESSPPRHS